MPDWLRTTVWIFGVLALLLTVVVGYLMWRYRIPPRGLFAMGGAALYLISPIDLVPEAILGPLGLVDDAGVLVAVALFIYKLVKARQILADGGIELGRRPVAGARSALTTARPHRPPVRSVNSRWRRDAGPPRPRRTGRRRG